MPSLTRKPQSVAPSTPANPPRKGLEHEFNSRSRRKRSLRATSASRVHEGLGIGRTPLGIDGGVLGATWIGPASATPASADIRESRIDIIVVLQGRRGLTRPPRPIFALWSEIFDARSCFVRVGPNPSQFPNTPSSMGRFDPQCAVLSFGLKFEREVPPAKRIRRKSRRLERRKGMWMGRQRATSAMTRSERKPSSSTGGPKPRRCGHLRPLS